MRWQVVFGTGTGVTRDMSISGALIETELALRKGDAVGFAVRMPDRASLLRCEGKVTRVECLEERWDVAVRFDAIRFE